MSLNKTSEFGDQCSMVCRGPFAGIKWDNLNECTSSPVHCTEEIWKRYNSHWRQKRLSASTRVRVNKMTIVTSPFSNNSIFKCFPFAIKREERFLKFLLFEKRRFGGQLFGIGVDGRPNRRDKAALSDFSGLVWGALTIPEFLKRNKYKLQKCRVKHWIHLFVSLCGEKW